MVETSGAGHGRRTAGRFGRCLLAGVLGLALASCDLPQYPDGTEQRVMQAGVTHRGHAATAISDDAVVRWRHQFLLEDRGAAVGTPLVIGERVIAPVMVGGPDRNLVRENASRVVAFDRLSGRTLWDRRLGHERNLQVTSKGDRLYVLGDLWLKALDLETGRVLWTTEIIGQRLNAPVAAGSDVYLSAYGGSDIDLLAVDAATGRVRWRKEIDDMNGDESTPAVWSDRVYLSGLCGDVAVLRRSDGVQLWRHIGTCRGGGGSTAVVGNGRVYSVRQGLSGSPVGTGYIVSNGTGQRLGAFESRYAPVVTAEQMFVATNAGLESRSIDGRRLLWTGPTRSVQQPFASGETVFSIEDGPIEAGPDPRTSDTRTLVGLDLENGSERLRVDLGHHVSNQRANPAGMAAGNHVLAIAYGSEIVVVG